MIGLNIQKSYLPDTENHSHRDLIKISARSFSVIDAKSEDGGILMKDFGHAYAAFHGNVECMLLPTLGTEIPSMFQNKRNVGNANVLEFRTLAKRYLAAHAENGSDSGQVRALFDNGFIHSSRHLTDYEGWRKSTFERRLFFDRMGTIRRTGIDYHNQVLTVGPFFSMDPDEVNSDFCAIGDVYGLCVRAGKVYSPALLPRNTLIQSASGALSIRKMSMDDMVLETESGKRLSPGSREDIRFHVRHPKALPHAELGEDCYGFVIIRDRVIAWATEGQLAVPASGCVVVIRKTAGFNAEAIESLMDTGLVKWTLDGDIREAFQGGPRLVSEGRVVPSGDGMDSFCRGDEDTRCVPATFHKFVESEERAKSIVGFDRDGNLRYLIGASCSARELSEIAAESGMTDAILADSGGSACAFIGNGALFQNRDQRGTDFAYWDRPTPIAIVLS